VRRRVAFVDYFCPHYRRPLFEELARRMEMDFYFFSDARDKWWNSRLPTIEDGDFRRIALRRYRIAGEPFVPALPLRLRPDRYDAVIKNLNGRLMLPALYGAARLRQVPFVLWTGMWFHPRTPFHRLSRPVTEALYRDVPAIVVYGEHVKRVLLEVPGVEAEKIFVAGQAVDASRFEAVQPARNGGPVVLFVGQFEERKGIDDLLAAFERVADPDAELRLIGNGSLERHIRQRTNGHSRVTIVGHVPQDALPAELARATCLVLPSVTTRETNEPWGLVVNEAMHAGLPVIATDAVGAAAGGLVHNGRNGYVVPERNPERLGDAMRRLLGDPESAVRMGRQARADAAEFNYDRMADAFQGAVEYAVQRGWS
jgi:glycosyltransferase involved in cell wall biosynthesis